MAAIQYNSPIRTPAVRNVGFKAEQIVRTETEFRYTKNYLLIALIAEIPIASGSHISMWHIGICITYLYLQLTGYTKKKLTRTAPPTLRTKC